MAVKDHIRREMMAERRRRWGMGGGPHGEVVARIAALAAFGAARRIAGYMATPGEVDLEPLLRPCLGRGLALWLPRFNGVAETYEMVAVTTLESQVVAGAFGIREPLPTLPAVSPAERCAPGVLWLVPGVAFDPRGNRLGRGQGHYDRLLGGTRGVRVGVAWDWQLLEEVPHSPHDMPMDWIVTETRTIACGAVRAALAK